MVCGSTGSPARWRTGRAAAATMVVVPVLVVDVGDPSGLAKPPV